MIEDQATIYRTWMKHDLIRDENGSKRLAKGPSLSLSHFFIGNENVIDITVILETEIYDREHIDNDQNPSKRYFEKR
jgi:hypothetical protein